MGDNDEAVNLCDAGDDDIALRQLALSPEKILFVDDRPANVLAARAQGMGAVLFETAAATSGEQSYSFGSLLEVFEECGP